MEESEAGGRDSDRASPGLHQARDERSSTTSLAIFTAAALSLSPSSRRRPAASQKRKYCTPSSAPLQLDPDRLMVARPRLAVPPRAVPPSDGHSTTEVLVPRHPDPRPAAARRPRPRPGCCSSSSSAARTAAAREVDAVDPPRLARLARVRRHERVQVPERRRARERRVVRRGRGASGRCRRAGVGERVRRGREGGELGGGRGVKVADEEAEGRARRS